MARAFALALLVCACVHPHGPPPVVSLPLDGVADGQIVVPVKVNGSSMRFLVDTGSPATLITPKAAIELGLASRDKGWVAVGAGGGVDPLTPIVLEHVSIGDVEYRLQAFIAPFDGRAFDPSLAGVLGEDFLARHDVEIDFARQTLRLLPPGTAPRERGDARLSFVEDVGMLQVKGTLDGRDVAAVLDLGATASIVNPDGAPGIAPAHRATAIGADGNPIAVSPHDFARLALGDATFSAPTLYVGALPLFAWLHLDRTAAVLVGIDLFAGRRLVIDYRDHELRIGPAPLAAVAAN